jgi:ATP-dependent DNA helicase PIF1
MQRFVYDIVNTHFNSISSNREPLRLIIVGVAGTGKSYLINALRNLLQGKCTVTATTGKASYNIRGVTIHSLVKLPIGSRDKKELAGPSLCRLQDSLNGAELTTFLLMNTLCLAKLLLAGWISVANKQLDFMTKS